MHSMKARVIGRGWLLGAIAAIIAVVGLLPLFGSTAYAAGLSLDNTVAYSQFRIPAQPVTRTNGAIDNGTVDQAPFTLNVDDTAPFPASGQILVTNGAWGDGTKANAEIMTYDSKTATSFNITQRGPAKLSSSVKKAHPDNSLIKLATTLSTDITAGAGPSSALTSAIAITAGGCTTATDPDSCPNGGASGVGGITPFKITVADASAIKAACSGVCPIAIGHQDTATTNVGGQTGELMEITDEGNPCTSVATNELCVTARSRQSNNVPYEHKANGYGQPDNIVGTGTQAGVSEVTLAFQANVKSNAGFFPSGPLLVCDADNPLTNCEILSYNNATKSKTPSGTEFHITNRCGAAGTYNKSCVSPPAHLAADTIVTGADAFLFCRNRSEQPGVDTDLATAGVQEPAGQTPGTSVGTKAVCYTQSQPEGAPKTVPGGSPAVLVGQDLVVLNALPVPFLSTGGTPAFLTILPATAVVDSNGTTDGVLNLISPCIPNFTPGVNLQVEVSLIVDKDYTTPDSGTIKVTLDAVTGPSGGPDGNPATHDECDDPAGTDIITSTTYVSPSHTGASDVKAGDTDKDGCTDERELRGGGGTFGGVSDGGLRDPWNPYDYADVNHDGAIAIGADILAVAGAFGGSGGPNYTLAKDRGPTYGPFSWNASAADGSVAVGVDILGTAGQFGHACPHTHNTGQWTGANEPWYGPHP